MTIEHNEQIVRRIFEGCINSGRLDGLAELIAEDYVAPNGAKGRGGFIGPLTALHNAFPDIRYRIEDAIAANDRVAVRWVWQGTHENTLRGPLGTYEPTGKTITNSGIALIQVKDGQVVRAWLETDRLGFLQQVGAVKL